MTDAVVSPPSSVAHTSRTRLLVAFGLVALLIAMVPGSMLLRRAAHGPQVTPIVSGTAPQFSLPALDGSTVSLASLRGRPVIVNFWASWCTPCREEFDVLSAAARDHAADNVAIVGVLFDDIPRDARSFVAHHHGTWPSGIDDDGATARAYGVNELPQSFFVRPDGTLQSHVFGGLTTRVINRQIKLALR